jgi:hypothetical protein
METKNVPTIMTREMHQAFERLVRESDQTPNIQQVWEVLVNSAESKKTDEIGFENVCKNRTSAYYSVFRQIDEEIGMATLRTLFQGSVNELNLVLFSTSGVHGTYTTIEQAEDCIKKGGQGFLDITFLIIHPRLVTLKYGLCTPKNQNDIDFLKWLRQESKKALMNIGEGQ